VKTTGVVRRIDDLGRIVIPKELRRTLRIRDGESLEIFVENEMITLKKYSSMSDIKEISNNLRLIKLYLKMLLLLIEIKLYQHLVI